MNNPNGSNDMGICDVAGCENPAGVEWPMLGRRVCAKHYTPEYSPAGAFDGPDDFDIPGWDD